MVVSALPDKEPSEDEEDCEEEAESEAASHRVEGMSLLILFLFRMFLQLSRFCQ